MNESVERLETQLKDLSSGDPESTERIDALNDLAWELGLTQTKRALELAEEASRVSEHVDYKKGIALGHRTIGYCNLVFSNLEEAIQYSHTAVRKLDEIDEKLGKATAVNTLSLIYARLGRYDEALRAALSCLELSKETGSKLGEAWAIHNVGYIYTETGDYQLALENQHRALELFREIPHPVGEARALAMLGILYEKNGEYDKALEHHQQAVRKSEEQGVHIGATVGLANVGQAYLKLGDIDKALDYCLRALESGKNIANREVNAITLLTLGNVYLEMGDNNKACEALRKSLREIKDTQAKPTELKIHEALASLHEANGELDKALEHYKRFHDLKEEIFNDESTTKFKNLQIRVNVETAEKEAEIQRLRYVELAGMLAQLVQSEKMAALGSLVAGISHEANTPIGVIKNNAGLSRQALDLMQQELEKEGLMDRLRKNGTWTRALDILNTSARTTVVASERISNLVTNLKQFSHLDEAELQMADVAEGIENTLMLLRPQLAPGVEIRKELAELPKIECYASELNQCFMTLLVNASDALDGEGSITIKTSAGDADIFIEISDTGRGIPAEKLANPFEIMFSQKDSRMRMRVGLSNTYNIIKKHGGDIKVASQVGQGTTFRIRLPIRQKART